MFKGLGIGLLIAACSLCVNAAKIDNAVFEESVVVSEVTSIYDGDTFRVNIEGWPEIVGYHIPVRVAHIDTPEIKGRCPAEEALARQAKQVTVGMLRNAKHIELRNIKRGKYFRIVAEPYADNKSIADELIRQGLAVRYEGGRKTKDWCAQ